MLPIVALIIVSMISSNARAVISFTPVQCAVCPNTVEIAWIYDSLAELPHDPNAPSSTTRYNNNMLHFRNFVANSYVSEVKFWFDTTDIDIYGDFLAFQQSGASTTIVMGIQSQVWVQPATPSNPQHVPLDYFFNADSSVNGAGFKIDKVQVCCDSTAQWPFPVSDNLPDGQRATGVVLGTNDVVYFSRPAGPTGTRLHVVAWGSGTTDLDIYVRCNAWPNPNNFNYRGFSSNADEFVAATQNECAGGTWKIAVHSYSGSGQFNLVASDAKVNTQNPYRTGILDIRVGFGVGIGGSSLASYVPIFKNTTEKALKDLYGVSEGKIFPSSCEIFNNAGPDCVNGCGGQPCDICYIVGLDRSTASICSPTGPVMIRAQTNVWSNYRIVTHELVHKYLCVSDEYSLDPPGCYPGGTCNADIPHCGHSIMSILNDNNQNNLCLDGANPWAFSNHMTDGAPGFTPPLPLEISSWDRALLSSQRILSKPSTTPDNFNYVAHDFNGAIFCQVP